MSINIGSYPFEGPYGNPANLANKSGVYAVLTRATANDNYSVLDIGESGMVRDRLSNHDRQTSWGRLRKPAGLAFAAYYCDEAMRMAIERMLRDKYNPPCGER